jgi:hypothetical protein
MSSWDFQRQYMTAESLDVLLYLTPLRRNARIFIYWEIVASYPVLPHLLTPFKDRGQLSRAQINYNGKLSSNRYVIEHCFGLLKQKFRQLYHLKLRKLEDMVHFIRACCVLHNMALDDDFPLNEGNNEAGNVGIPFLNNDENDPDEEPDDRNGVQIRNQVVNILEQRRRGERRQ